MFAIDMTADIVKSYVSKEHLYSLGKDTKIDCYILSIPVSNSLVDYEEYYKLTLAQHQKFSDNIEAAKNFADECRLSKHDDLLTLAPGTDRGVPR